MSTKQSGFTYSGSKKIASWGCHFDSLTELKYAISIMEDYEFLRERVAIFYNPSTREPIDYLQSNYRRYTPDFLIRHKTTGEAFLVEVKPSEFRGDAQLDLRRELAERYIKKKQYDWEFKVVYDDEILLSEEQLEDFRECCRLRSRNALNLWIQQFNQKMDRALPSALKNASPEARIRYIMFGNTNQPGSRLW